ARARGDTQGFLRPSGVPDQDPQQAGACGLPDGGAPGFLRAAAKDRPPAARHPLAERVPQLSAHRLGAAPPAARFRMTRFWRSSASAYYGPASRLVVQRVASVSRTEGKGKSMACRSPLRAFAALVVLTLTGAIATLATAQVCAPGSSSATGFEPCTDCSPGSFQPSSGQTTCPACDAGNFQASTGQTTCTSCAIGTFQASSGASTCQSCTPGTANPNVGASSCPACDAGTFTDSAGQSSCASCNPGTFQGSSGQSSCASCATGTFQASSGASTCQSCPPGTANPS